MTNVAMTLPGTVPNSSSSVICNFDLPQSELVIMLNLSNRILLSYLFVEPIFSIKNAVFSFDMLLGILFYAHMSTRIYCLVS